MKKPGLLTQLGIALVLGALAGLYLPACGVRALNTFREFFGQLIKFLVPFIVIGLVTPAIADTGKQAGKMLLLTMGIAVASTIFAGYYSFFMSCTFLPLYIDPGLNEHLAASKDFPAYFKIAIPPLTDIVTALVFSFMTGLGIVATKAERVAAIFSEFREIVTVTIAKAFVPLLPVYVMTVIADIAACGKLAAVAGPCIKLMVSCVAFTTILLLVQYSVAGLVVRRNPFRALWNMMPAYLTGWGCCSSAATIPADARTTPPGTPGDATATMLSMKMKCVNGPIETGSPAISRSPAA